MPKSNANEAKGTRKQSNRSQAVRDALVANPGASSKDIIAQLAGRGMKVSPTLVYYIKSKQSKARRIEKRARVAATSRSTGTRDPVQVVIRVKELAREVGGVQNLKLLVDLLAE
jgi:hypothetical protein